MKIAVIIVRVLLGLLFLFASVSFFFKLFPAPEMQGDIKTFNEGLMVAVYMMPLVKFIELLCGVLFLIGRYVTLATVLIFPISLNIFLYHTFMDTTGIPIAIFVLVANLFLAYYHRNNYKSLFVPK